MTTNDNHTVLSVNATGGCCGSTPTVSHNQNDASTSAGGCCCESTPSGNSNQSDASTSAAGGCCGSSPMEDLTNMQAGDVTACPVMVGTPVVKSEAEKAGFYRDYHGQRYWMCCGSCGPVFDADPERYAAA